MFFYLFSPILTNSNGSLQKEKIYSFWGYLFHFENNGGIHIPTDNASILILAKELKILSSRWKVSDYIPKEVLETHQILLNPLGFEKVKDLTWKVQNPGEQLSGTFFPTPISSAEDLIDWYSTSIFIQDKPTHIVQREYTSHNFIVVDVGNKGILNPDKRLKKIFENILSTQISGYNLQYWDIEGATRYNELMLQYLEEIKDQRIITNNLQSFPLYSKDAIPEIVKKINKICEIFPQFGFQPVTESNIFTQPVTEISQKINKMCEKVYQGVTMLSSFFPPEYE